MGWRAWIKLLRFQLILVLNPDHAATGKPASPRALPPDRSSRACEDPDLARRTRIDILERTADGGIAVLPAHFDPAMVERARETNRFAFDRLTTAAPGP